MADRLTRMLGRAAAGLLAFCLAGFGPALAQSGFADPTRPPASLQASPGSASEVEAAKTPTLQSVLIPDKGKPVALIGGRELRLGEMLGDRRLVKLTEREAVLVGPAGSERLSLTPGAEKTNVTAKPPGAPQKRVQRGEK